MQNTHSLLLQSGSFTINIIPEKIIRKLTQTNFYTDLRSVFNGSDNEFYVGKPVEKIEPQQAFHQRHQHTPNQGRSDQHCRDDATGGGHSLLRLSLWNTAL